jgi:hypothetical protein
MDSTLDLSHLFHCKCPSDIWALGFNTEKLLSCVMFRYVVRFSLQWCPHFLSNLCITYTICNLSLDTLLMNVYFFVSRLLTCFLIKYRHLDPYESNCMEITFENLLRFVPNFIVNNNKPRKTVYGFRILLLTYV